MDYYNDLPERICHIRKHYMSIPEQYEYDDLPFYENKSSLSSANCRKVADALSTLLVVYQEDGTEWSISPAGRRLVHREFPRLGWFHKHEYVEIFYVIEGSFTQVLFGEKIAPKLGIIKRFVGTEPNCCVTSAYNRRLKKLLPKYGIELIETERLKGISASKVRELIRTKRLEESKTMVPETTYEEISRFIK